MRKKLSVLYHSETAGILCDIRCTYEAISIWALFGTPLALR